jgi:hypothetical protein
MFCVINNNNGRRGFYMRLHTRIIVAVALGGTMSPALFAQQIANDTSIATETQERTSEGQDQRIPWDYLGLLGLAGLFGLRKRGGGARIA